MYVLPLGTTRIKISELEDMAAKTVQNETQKILKTQEKNGQSLGELRDNFRRPNICVIGAGKLLEEIMTIECPNLLKTINPQISEAQQTPRTGNSNETTRHVIVKLFTE